MAVSNREELVKKFKQHENDCGSVEVQVVQLTERIVQLTKHAGEHAKDHSTKRGLIKLVNRRKKFLTYLQKNNKETYKELIQELGLRK